MEPLLWTADAPCGRLDRFLADRLEGISRARIQTAIRQGLATMNGKTTRPAEPVRVGATVAWSEPPPPQPRLAEPEDIPLPVVFEDEFLVVVDKPAGMVVHPAPGNPTGTLVAALLHRLGKLEGGTAGRPGIIHRLDKETSGLLVVARTQQAHSHLAAQFANREVQKIYLAVVTGAPRRSTGTLDAPIGRHPVHRKKMTVREGGRMAVTAYRVLSSSWRQSLVECRPATGRTHQIRVHLKHLGCPVLGDPLYGKRADLPRHLLHAWQLGFTHPVTGRALRFQAPLPGSFLDPMDPEIRLTADKLTDGFPASPPSNRPV